MSQQATTGELIAQLHRAYVQCTGLSLPLDMQRESMWFDWLRCLKPQLADMHIGPEQALRIVIMRIRAGICSERRQPGALKFRNLIGQPDYFQEDLAEALAVERARKRQGDPSRAEVLDAIGRGAAAPAHGDRTISAVMKSAISEVKPPESPAARIAFEQFKKFKDSL